MKKLKYLLILSLLLVPANLALAANNVTISADTTLTFTSPAISVTLVIYTDILHFFR
jgi:hypothetical protein